MTIVIPLFNYRDNIELRYALRSLRNLLNVTRVCIVTDKLPEWMQNVEHIFANDIPGEQWKEYNIYKKLMIAATRHEEFLYMNDDHYILHKVDANIFPVHHKGALYTDSRTPSDTYRRTIANTLKYFPGTMNFDTHCPINMRSGMLHDIKVDWKKPYGYCLKTLYANVAKLTGMEYPDAKLYRSAEIPHKSLYFSTDNRAMDEKMINRFENKFPGKSIYEK